MKYNQGGSEMAIRKLLSCEETIAFSTSTNALRILKNGSADLLTAFQYGIFEESADGVVLRSPGVPISVIQEIGTELFLLQLDALEAEVKSLGINVKEGYQSR